MYLSEYCRQEIGSPVSLVIRVTGIKQTRIFSAWNKNQTLVFRLIAGYKHIFKSGLLKSDLLAQVDAPWTSASDITGSLGRVTVAEAALQFGATRTTIRAWTHQRWFKIALVGLRAEVAEQACKV